MRGFLLAKYKTTSGSETLTTALSWNTRDVLWAHYNPFLLKKVLTFLEATWVLPHYFENKQTKE